MVLSPPPFMSLIDQPSTCWAAICSVPSNLPAMAVTTESMPCPASSVPFAFFPLLLAQSHKHLPSPCLMLGCSYGKKQPTPPPASSCPGVLFQGTVTKKHKTSKNNLMLSHMAANSWGPGGIWCTEKASRTCLKRHTVSLELRCCMSVWRNHSKLLLWLPFTRCSWSNLSHRGQARTHHTLLAQTWFPFLLDAVAQRPGVSALARTNLGLYI